MREEDRNRLIEIKKKIKLGIISSPIEKKFLEQMWNNYRVEYCEIEQLVGDYGINKHI
ncbi:MAG: hypothetical protein AABY32_01050 [Nanoarchaeota archaeon]